MTIQERQRTSESASSIQQRTIARVLRKGLDMISEGESLTYEPDTPLKSVNKRWVESGMAVRSLNLIMGCAVPGSTIEVVDTDSDTPLFVVHKGHSTE